MLSDRREPLRAVLADDEPLARQALRTALVAHPGVQLVGEAVDGMDAVDVVCAARPDLLLLDIRMPGLDGFGVLEALGPAVPPAVIFVTAHDVHAVAAFERDAVDYVVKPFDELRLHAAVDRAIARRAPLATPAETLDRLERLLAALAPAAPPLERFVVRKGPRSVVVGLDEVDWVEAADNYVRLHAGAERHLVRETMRALDARLDPRRFARVHRSAIVNLSRVKELRALPGGDHDVHLSTGATLTLGRAWRDLFERRLGGRL